jgi:hypothetical protein
VQKKKPDQWPGFSSATLRAGEIFLRSTLVQLVDVEAGAIATIGQVRRQHWILTVRKAVPDTVATRVDTRVTRRHLIHLRVTHGRGLHGRYMSFVLLNLGCKRHAGASRTDHGKHKYRLPHEAYSLKSASQPRRIIFKINHYLVRFN